MPGRSGSIAARATGRASSFDSRGRPVSTNAVRAEPTGARLLVVDDEPSMIRTLRTNLRGHGFQVETAETAGDAIASYERRQPDLVVLDLNLPDGDGFEVVRRIRELSGTPIIVLSARGGEHDKVNALDLGADDYMTKPFGIDELLATKLRGSGLEEHIARHTGSIPERRTPGGSRTSAGFGRESRRSSHTDRVLAANGSHQSSKQSAHRPHAAPTGVGT